MKILFITNLPSPYRVDFFNELGKSFDLTVCYERHHASDRDAQWKGAEPHNYKEIYLAVKPIGMDQSIGLDAVKKIRTEKFDKLFISGYASPSIMLAITYCRISHIPYYIESDGGFNRKDKIPKLLLKKFLLCGAVGHFTTCEEHIQYLKSIGVEGNTIVKYPFTSLRQTDILTQPPTIEEKKQLRKQLGMTEEHIVISVGQLIYRKGYDILLEAARNCDTSIGIYIIGGNPTQENLNEKDRLRHMHFINFMPKQELKKWYCAADLFVLPTREDIWGLVINEAMACGLPVITTERCIAGLELVENADNGYIVPVGDARALYEKIHDVLTGNNCRDMGRKSIVKIQPYTIENMAARHRDRL